MEYRVWRLGEQADRSKKKDIERKFLQKPPTDLAMEESPAFNSRVLQTSGLSKTDMELGMAEMNQDSNRRDSLNCKLSDRYLIQQVNQNPFMAQGNYMDDLYIQEQFLRPKTANNIAE